jgi:hypothetical protein
LGSVISLPLLLFRPLEKHYRFSSLEAASFPIVCQQDFVLVLGRSYAGIFIENSRHGIPPQQGILIGPVHLQDVQTNTFGLIRLIEQAIKFSLFQGRRYGSPLDNFFSA